MLAVKHIEIYLKYRGNEDALARCGTVREKKILTKANFKLIEKLIQHSGLVLRGITSKEFVAELNTDLKKNCKDEETIKFIKKLAEG